MKTILRQTTVRFFPVSLSSFIVIILSNIIISSPLVLSSSTNRNSYSVYNYDQTASEFTPDGSLLQVEYASAAADLSPPLVILECFSSSSSKSIDNNGHHQYLILLSVRKQANSLQNRIVILEDKDEQSKRGINPGFPYKYCCVMSGILSDSLCLLQAGMKVAAQHSLQYQTSLGMADLTQVLADECQTRVFRGGLRPYGSTLLLCGFDKACDEEAQLEGNNEFLSSIKRNINHHRRPLIYQTDPSGGIIQHHAQYSDNNSDADQSKKSRKYRNNNDDHNDTIIQSQVRCIVGGSQSLQRQLYERINQGMAKFEQQQRSRRVVSLADRIANLAKILTKEMNNDRKAKIDKSRNDNLSVSSHFPLEIVLISPRLGCHRLDNKQIQAIQQLINEDSSSMRTTKELDELI